MRNVVEERHRRIEQTIAECEVDVGESQQLLAQLRAVGEVEPAHATDPVRGLAPFDLAVGDGWMPAVMAIEVAQQLPHRPTGASRTVLLTTFTMPRSASPREMPLQGVETALKHVTTDAGDEIALDIRCAIEIGRPFDERALAIGHGRQPECRHIVRRSASGSREWRRCRTGRDRKGRAASRGCGRRSAAGSRGCSRPCRPARRFRCGSRGYVGASAADH